MAVEEETDIRSPVAEHLQPDLRLYRRLYLAEGDLLEAKAALDEILKARIRIPRNEDPPPLLQSLTTAMVVAYARPWVESRGQSVANRTVPGALLRSLTTKQRAIHDFLVGYRNRHIAHSDADILDLHLRLYPDGHSAILRHFREPFRRSELMDIRRVIVKLENAIEARCIDLRYKLPRETWI